MKVKEVEIRIESRDDFFKGVKKDLKDIMDRKKVRKKRVVSFENLREVLQTLTPARLALLHTVHAKAPHSIYALAKMLGRKEVNVNRDVHLLAELGFLELKKEKNKRTLKPVARYDEIAVRIPLKQHA